MLCIFSAYELWFKQIIYEIDSIREIFMGSEKLQQFSLMSLTDSQGELKTGIASVDERVMLDINKRFVADLFLLKHIDFSYQKIDIRFT